MKEHGKIKEHLKKLMQLFLIFFKVGLFSFGGGYTMVIFYEREFVEKRKWMTSDEFSDLLAIAESTPGPIAINSSTYIGYRIAGFLGSFISTVATCLPSFIIIFVISLFFDEFLQFELVQYAFKGIQAGVSLLILIAGIKMFKKMKKSKFNVIIISVSSVLILTFSILAIKFSSIYYILAGATYGLVCYFVALVKNKKELERTENGKIINTISENDLGNSENDKRVDNAEDNIIKTENNFGETDLLKAETNISEETELTKCGNKFGETDLLKAETDISEETELTKCGNKFGETDLLKAETDISEETELTECGNKFGETDLLKAETDIFEETELTECGNKFDEETNVTKIESSFGDEKYSLRTEKNNDEETELTKTQKKFIDETDFMRNENNLNKAESSQDILQEEKTNGGNGGEK